jgi:CheY-like chemotaxis protein
MKKIIIIIAKNNHSIEEGNEWLQMDGYETTTANNGVIGLEKIFDFKPDLIICDIMMPEMDGFQLSNHYRTK